jgi:hypothetical protein
MPGSRRVLEALAALALLVVLLLALHRGAAFGGGLLAPFDILGQYEPWKSGMAAERPQNPALSDQVTLHPFTPLAANRFVIEQTMTLWSPFQGCGTPLHGNTLSAQLYPLMWLHALFPRQAALLLIGLLKGLLTGFFFFLLLRRRGVSNLAATTAALALPISGFYALWLGHQHTAVASLLPLLLWLTDRAVDRPSSRALALVGVCSGATLLAGHLETALHVLLISTFYAFLRCMGGDGTFVARLARLGKIAGGYLIGAAISMVQIIPFAEYSLHSAILAIRHHPLYRFHNAWRDLEPGEALPAALSIAALIATFPLTAAACRAIRARADLRGTLLLLLAVAAAVFACATAFRLGLIDQLELLVDPDRRGSPLEGRGHGAYVGYLLYIEFNCGFASIAALPLALAALALRPARDRMTLFLGALATLSLMIVFEWPLIAHAISRLPIFAEAKNKRFLLLSSLAILWLAAKGIDLLRDAARRGERRAIFAPFAASIVLIAGILGGRSFGEPLALVGLPSVPRVHSDESWLAEAGKSLSRERPAAMLRGLERDRAFAAGTIALDGLLATTAGESVERVEVEAFGPEGRAEARLEVDGAIRTSARGEEGKEGDDLVDLRELKLELDATGAPSGRYALSLLLRSGGEARRVALGGLYVSRPKTEPFVYAALLLALLAIAAFAIAPAFATPAALLLAALIVADLFRFADGFNPAVDPKWDFPTTPSLDHVIAARVEGDPRRVTATNAALLPANVATAYGLHDTRVYDSIDVVHYNSFLTAFARPAIEGATRAPLDPTSRLFDLLAVRHVFTEKNAPPPAPWHVLEFDGEVRVYANPRAFPRAFLAERAIDARALIAAEGGNPDDPMHLGMLPLALRRAVDAGRIDLARHVVVLEPGAGSLLDALPPQEPLREPPPPLRFVEDDFDRLALEVNAERDGVLFLSDVYMPGWKAYADGKEVPVVRANVAFRAVGIAAGTKIVELRYEPLTTRIGLVFLAIGLALAGAMSLRRK